MAGRPCVCCQHSERPAIDEALLLYSAAYSRIAAKYGMDERSVRRHAHNHLGATVAASERLQTMLSSQNLLARLDHLDEMTLEMLTEARSAGDLRTALIAIKESRGNIESFSHIAEKAVVADQLAEIHSELAEVRAKWDSQGSEG